MTARTLIVVPMYNAASTVARTLDSVCAQTENSWRCVVVDDGSTDDSAEIARSFASRDARFKTVRQDNRGLSGARNTGIAQLAGEEFVLFLDADDEITPDALRTLVAAHDADDGDHPIVCAGAEVRDTEGRTLAVRRPDAPRLALRELLQMTLVLTHAQLFRASLFERFRYDESCRLVEDYELYFRLAHAGVTWTCIDDITALYRVSPKSLSRDADAMLNTTLKLLHGAASEAEPDWSPEDHARTRLHLACGYACRIALAGRTDDAFNTILRVCGDTALDTLTVPALARACADACVFGAALRADDPGAHERLLPLLEQIAEQKGEPEFAGDVLAKIASIGTDPAHRAAELVRQCAGAERVQLVGLGKNGARLLDLFARAGIEIVVRDDRIDRGDLDPPSHARIHVMRMDESFDAEHPVVISPLESDAIVRRLTRAGLVPDRARVLTWSGG